MAIRPITVTFKGTNYVGEYEVAEDLVRVLFENRVKTGVLRGHDAELLARIFLIELVSEVETAGSIAKPVKL